MGLSNSNVGGPDLLPRFAFRSPKGPVDLVEEVSERGNDFLERRQVMGHFFFLGRYISFTRTMAGRPVVVLLHRTSQ